MGRLPTRVIRVGSAREEPRLYVSNNECANYVTLSHCWGGVKPLITTTDTLEARTTCIPYDTLPKTFQDAVMITRSLGVEYLWIDSLCIIQDSVDDWAKEAASMKDVYADCYVMISADDSPNPHGGCLPVYEQPSRQSFVVNTVGPKLSKICHRIGDAQSIDESRSTLNQRGWCLQERILAPRVLHFGQSELAWECPEMVACECQTVATSLDKESRYKAMRGDHLLRQAQGSPKQSLVGGSKVDILLWMNFVEEFTRRHLTFNKDILHALAGLAAFMEAVTGAEYVHGIWKRELAEFLLWTTHKGTT
ncbi:HET-domain-containing protein, partial [Bimuria novae-zelandiae CBS 107.79]